MDLPLLSALQGLGLDFFSNLRKERIECHCLVRAVAAIAYSNRAILRLLIAHDEHIRNLLKLRLTNLIADLLATVVKLRTQACGIQRFKDATA